jgi:hypothetical protein
MRQPSRRPGRLRLEALEARDVPVNLLVTAASGMFGTPKTLIEYNPNGGIVASRTVPANPASGQVYARDVDVTAGGKIVVYNGTDPAAVSIFNGTGWTHVGMAGLSAYGEPHVGGVVTAGRYVFAPDMGAAGPGQASGIVRIDLTTLRPTRFLDGFEYFDLTVGLDGYLYGLRGQFGPIDKIDPATMEQEGSVLPGGGPGMILGVRGVAVNAAGNLFVVAANKTVYRLAPDGQIQASHVLPNPPEGGFFGETFDIDITNNGQELVIGSESGHYLAAGPGTTSGCPPRSPTSGGTGPGAGPPTSPSRSRPRPWSSRTSGSTTSRRPRGTPVPGS